MLRIIIEFFFRFFGNVKNCFLYIRKALSVMKDCAFRMLSTPQVTLICVLVCMHNVNMD